MEGRGGFYGASTKCQGLSKSQSRLLLPFSVPAAAFEGWLLTLLNGTEAQSARQAIQSHTAAAFSFCVSLFWLLSHVTATSLAKPTQNVLSSSSGGASRPPLFLEA